MSSWRVEGRASQRRARGRRASWRLRRQRPLSPHVWVRVANEREAGSTGRVWTARPHARAATRCALTALHHWEKTLLTGRGEFRGEAGRQRETPEVESNRLLTSVALLVGVVGAVFLLSAFAGARGGEEPLSTVRAEARALAAYGKLPLSFEPNRGQAQPGVRFLTRGAGYGLALTRTAATFVLDAPRSRSESLPTSQTEATGRTVGRWRCAFCPRIRASRLVGRRFTPRQGEATGVAASSSKWLAGTAHVRRGALRGPLSGHRCPLLRPPGPAGVRPSSSLLALTRQGSKLAVQGVE